MLLAAPWPINNGAGVPARRSAVLSLASMAGRDARPPNTCWRISGLDVFRQSLHSKGAGRVRAFRSHCNSFSLGVRAGV